MRVCGWRLWAALIVVSSAAPAGAAIEERDDFAPIQQVESARTLPYFRAQFQTWAERVLVKPMRYRLGEAAYAEEALRFARAAVQELWPSNEQIPVETLSREGERLSAAGCRDPLFLFLNARVQDRTRENGGPTPQEYEAALKGSKAAPGTSALVWLLERELWGLGISGGRAPEVVASMEAAMRDGSFTREDDQLLYRLWSGGDRPIPIPYARVFLPLADAAPLGEWLGKMMRALIEDGEAQGDWVNGMPRPGKEEGDPKRLESHDKRMELERRLLVEAWHLRPERSDAAVRMISRAEGGAAESRLWFDRATAVEFDDEAAYLEMLQMCKPEAGGSRGKVLAFGKACLETKRWETIVPRFFSAALVNLAQWETDWRTVYRQPELAAREMELDRGLLAEPSRAANVKLNLSRLAIDAYLTGDLKTAVSAYDQIGRHLSTIAAGKLKDLGITDFDEQMAAAAAPAGKVSAPVQAALEVVAAREAFRQAFERGEWLTLNLADEGPEWRGAFEDQLMPPGTPLAKIPRGRPGQRVHAFPIGDEFELRAEIPQHEGLAGSVLGSVFVATRQKGDAPPYQPCSDLLRVELRSLEKGQISAQVIGGNEIALGPAVTLRGRPLHTIEIKLTGGVFTVVVNGTELKAEIGYSWMDFFANDHMVFGYYAEPGAAISPSKLEVRRMIEAPRRGT